MSTIRGLTPAQRFHFYMRGWHDGAGVKGINMSDSETGSVLYLEGYEDGRKDGRAKADAAGNRFGYQQSTIRLAAAPAPAEAARVTPAVEARGVVTKIFESPDGKDYIHVEGDDGGHHNWQAACVPAARGAHGFRVNQRVKLALSTEGE